MEGNQTLPKPRRVGFAVEDEPKPRRVAFAVEDEPPETVPETDSDPYAPRLNIQRNDTPVSAEMLLKLGTQLAHHLNIVGPANLLNGGRPAESQEAAGDHGKAVDNQGAIHNQAALDHLEAAETHIAAALIFTPRYRELGVLSTGTFPDDTNLGGDSTAELAANSPRYRRKSSTIHDGVHDLAAEKASGMAPAQLYSTLSGRLFHSGRIAIILVGPPARGKTHISVSVARYLQWLGVKTRIFHLGDYRRATMGKDAEIPEDYFYTNASATSVQLRHKIIKKCRDDIYQWLNHENGQVAIYDAVNPLAVGRRALAQEFKDQQVQTLFLESHVTDNQILTENARSVKISSPDFVGMDPDQAARLYLERIQARIPDFETMNEGDLNFIKLVNAGEKQIVNNVNFGYISGRIVFYLTNLHIKSRKTFFARAGTSCHEDSYKADASLSDEGVNYAQKMTEALLSHRQAELAASIARTGSEEELKPLSVWTSTRKRTVETAGPLEAMGFPIRQRSEMSALNPGDCERLSEEEIRAKLPEEVEKHRIDPYHHRYPRAESYHDLAVRLEPIILELEREKNDLLIIAHESVLRVLYGYLMACDAMDIPKLKFPRNTIIEIVPASYQNEAKHVIIPGIESLTAPNSPENNTIRMGSFSHSGAVSPMVKLDPSMGMFNLGDSSLGVGGSTPLPTTGTATPIPTVINEAVPVDETNIVGKEENF